MKTLISLLLLCFCSQASITLQQLKNASYHLPAGYIGEGRGEVATIDKSKTVKFVNGKGEDANNLYWICGVQGTPDYSKTDKKSQYDCKLLPILQEDNRPIVCLKDSIAAVIIMVETKMGSESVVAILKDNGGTLEHIRLKTAYGVKYFTSIDIQSDKIIYVSKTWTDKNDTTEIDLYEKTYPTTYAPPPTYTPNKPSYRSDGIMVQFFSNMGFTQVKRLPAVPSNILGPMYAAGMLVGEGIKWYAKSQYTGSISQNQIVFEYDTFPILEVYSAVDLEGIPTVFLYSKDVVLGFNDTAYFKNVGGRFWLKVAFFKSGYSQQLILK